MACLTTVRACLTSLRAGADIVAGFEVLDAEKVRIRVKKGVKTRQNRVRFAPIEKEWESA